MLSFYILCFILIRFLAGYDSRYQNGKYIVIKNSILRIVLLDNASLFIRTKRPQDDINKMSVFGLIYYISAAFVLVVNVVLIIVPQIPIEPWGISITEFNTTDTLNEKVSVILVWLLLCAVMWYLAFEIIKNTKKQVEQKWIKFFVFAAVIIMLGVIGYVSLYMIKELVFCFL